jgi:hypothetical protein
MAANKKIRMDEITRECVERTYCEARLGRKGSKWARGEFLAEILIDLEESGDAMRYLDAKGRIAWKAPPKLRELIADLQKDVELEYEAEDT